MQPVLTIRREQLEAFADAQQRRFADTLAERLEASPTEVAGILENALGHGFETQDDAERWVTLRLRHGPELEAHPGVAEFLARPTLDPEVKLDEIELVLEEEMGGSKKGS